MHRLAPVSHATTAKDYDLPCVSLHVPTAGLGLHAQKEPTKL